MKNILPYITGVTAVLLWGAWFPITRYSVISSLGATDTIFFSILFGLVVYHTKLTLQVGICLALILFGFFLFAKGIGIIPIAGNLSTLIGVLFFIFAGLFLQLII